MAKKKEQPQQPEENQQPQPEAPKPSGNGHNGHKDTAEAIQTQTTVAVQAPEPEVDYTETPEFQQKLAEAAEKIRAEIEEQYNSDKDRAKAKLKLVNMAFDTPEAKLAELTIIPKQLVMWLVYQICLEAYADPKRDPIKTPISKVQRTAFFQLMRSVGGQHLIRAAALAQDQLRIEEEETGVPEKW